MSSLAITFLSSSSSALTKASASVSSFLCRTELRSASASSSRSRFAALVASAVRTLDAFWSARSESLAASSASCCASLASARSIDSRFLAASSCESRRASSFFATTCFFRSSAMKSLAARASPSSFLARSCRSSTFAALACSSLFTAAGSDGPGDGSDGPGDGHTCDGSSSCGKSNRVSRASALRKLARFSDSLASLPGSCTRYRPLASSNLTTVPCVPLSSGFDCRFCSTTRSPSSRSSASSSSIPSAPAPVDAPRRSRRRASALDDRGAGALRAFRSSPARLGT